MLKHDLHQFITAKQRSEHQGGAPVSVLHVQLSPMFDQQLRYGRIALETYPHQRRVAAAILCIRISARLQQQTCGFQMPVVAGYDQGGKSSAIGDVQVSAGYDALL